MDSQSGPHWSTSAWSHDDTSTSQLDNHWWAASQMCDSPIRSVADSLYLPPSVDSLSSYYGLGDASSFTLPSATAMAADSPSLFGPTEDDESMMSPPITPSISMAYPSPLASPGSSDSGISINNIKTKTKSSRGTDKSKTSRKPSSSDNSSDSKLQRARTWHNVVEKNYRNRLNGQFELMLATLNESRARTGQQSGEIEGDGEEYDRPPSKSAVLQLARERLISLEKENESLRHEVERLRDSSHSDFSYSRTALV
ncbi:hypothetical protein QBC34DRAFT_489586 [Podospora aff. communis PSN243]|uniref:BHLH domain-containing protein n=1 Tax=Podospora aff. communis PSN243 TaxID=3040156 RepID=A0AAV9H2I8_9PEZI|nr:hypothetical protein QBC34DRAFT_489586 [Podospora aff. communis PSN243]